MSEGLPGTALEGLEKLLETLLPEARGRWIVERACAVVLRDRGREDVEAFLRALDEAAAGRFAARDAAGRRAAVESVFARPGPAAETCLHLLKEFRRAYYHSPAGWRSVGRAGPLFAAWWPRGLQGALETLVRWRARFHRAAGGRLSLPPRGDCR